MKKVNLLEKCLLCSAAAVFVFQCTAFSSECRDIENSIVRMHVIANSDSQCDQSIKLVVRDGVVKAGEALLGGAETKKEAMKILSENLELLQKTADGILLENGCTYKSVVSLEKTYFPTRQYEKITLPPGEYDSLLVKLGDASGHNFWCVMFPSMCLPAAEDDGKLSDVLSPREYDIVSDAPKYKVEWKTAELFSKLREWLTERRK